MLTHNFFLRFDYINHIVKESYIGRAKHVEIAVHYIDSIVKPQTEQSWGRALKQFRLLIHAQLY